MSEDSGNAEQTGGAGAGAVGDIQAWMIARLSEELQLSPTQIDVTRPHMEFGWDSIVAFRLTGELADRLGCDLPATLFWDHPTLESLAKYLNDSCNGRRTHGAA